MTRECGTCTACCTHVKCDPMGKAAGTPCPALAQVQDGMIGCLIYQDRPSCCQTYRCAWLEGLFSGDDRPDKSGVLFERVELGDDSGGGGVFVLLGEVIDHPRDVAYWAKFVDASTVAVIRWDGGDVTYGGSRAVYEWSKFLMHCERTGEIKSIMADGVSVVSL